MTATRKEIDQAIGARLRAARITAGLSQQDLAKALGISFQQVQKYEKGTNRVAMSTALLMEQALGVPAATLFPNPADVAGDAFGPASAQAQSRLGAELAKIFVAMPPDRQKSLIAVARAIS